MEIEIASVCAMCGKALHEDHPVHDATGNLYCHSCLERLHGHSTHPRNGVATACGLCGALIESPPNGQRCAKGNYCPDCVARLRGEHRPRRIPVALPEPAQDVTFEQMLQDVLSPPPGASAVA